MEVAEEFFGQSLHYEDSTDLQEEDSTFDRPVSVERGQSLDNRPRVVEKALERLCHSKLPHEAHLQLAKVGWRTFAMQRCQCC